MLNKPLADKLNIGIASAFTDADIAVLKQEFNNLRDEVIVLQACLDTFAYHRAVNHGNTEKILSDLDDQVQRKYDWSKNVWDYKMNKRGEGFREALLIVRSMIHAAKEKLK